MKRKVEILKNENIRQKIVDLVEEELYIPIILVNSSKEILGEEEYQIPIDIDLEEYTNEKLNDIVSEYEEEILDFLESQKSNIFDSTMSFDLKDKTLKAFLKVSNRDQDNEECINLIMMY